MGDGEANGHGTIKNGTEPQYNIVMNEPKYKIGEEFPTAGMPELEVLRYETFHGDEDVRVFECHLVFTPR